MSQPKANSVARPPRALKRKLAEKRARREAKEARNKKGPDWTRIVYLTLIAAIAVSAIVLVTYMSTHPDKTIQPAVGPQQQVGEKLELQAANHIVSGQARYLTDPPTSGPHYNLRGEAPLAWGFYAQPYPPENWLHNLEHGGVVILYLCPQPERKTGGAKLIEKPLSCPDTQSPVEDFMSSAPKMRYSTR